MTDRRTLLSDIEAAAHFLRGSSWPGEMAQQMEERADRLEAFVARVHLSDLDWDEDDILAWLPGGAMAVAKQVLWGRDVGDGLPVATSVTRGTDRQFPLYRIKEG